MTKYLAHASQTNVQVQPMGPDARSTPTDPGLDQQWHLHNTQLAGVDLNVLGVWDEFTGAGVTVGVIDDGVEHTHPDLDGNYDFTLDADLRDGDDDAGHADPSDSHGTAVAGMIAAEANGEGVVGIAFNATVAGLRIGFGADGNNAQFVGAFVAARNFDIVNNSWGFNDFFVDDLNSATFAPTNAELVDAIDNGRGGLGTIVVFAAGNEGAEGQDVNYHGFQNSPHTIAVGAIEIDGDLASFSTSGAAVLTSAPGVDVLMTDRVGAAGYDAGDYLFSSGTSFSSPAVSAVIALMLEANADLGYRDVQEILALTSHNPKPTDQGGWQTNGADFWNGGGLTVHDGYGFGLADAHAAVRLAEVWQDQSTFDARDFVSGSAAPNAAISDNAQISSSITLNASNFAIDHVLVDVNIDHSFIGDLIVTLTSPDGTVSTLVNRPGRVNDGSGTDQNDIRFELTSVQYWGEAGDGEWTLQISDNADGDVGTLENWTLTLLGDIDDDNDQYYFTDEWATLGGGARQTLSDTAGTDTVNFAAFSSDVTFNLAAGASNLVAGHAIDLDGASIFENFIGGDGADIITGGDGVNDLKGMRGDDHISGGSGGDTLIGNGGADELYGNAGADTLSGGSGDDNLNGGSGLDTADYTGSSGAILARLNKGTVSDGDGGTDTLVDIENITGSGFNDVLIGDTGANVLTGGDGDDRLDGGGGTDRLVGGNGNDSYTVDSADDVVVELAGGGLDRINASWNCTLPENVEYLVGKFCVDWALELKGSSGNDRISGTHKINFADTLWGNDGRDVLHGMVGNDTLYGGAGNDRIFGQSGDDTIIGGTGRDRMTGQFGEDTFVFDFGHGRDRITDFDDRGDDLLDLSALSTDFSTLENQMTQQGLHVLIDFNNGDTILLERTDLASITSDDFLF